MIIGLDTNQPLTNFADRLAGRGYKFAARYLRRSGAWTSNLRLDEVNALTAAGIKIVSVFQHKSNRIDEFSIANAKIDGAAARKRANEIGQPAWAPIYVAFDTDFAESHARKILDYGLAFAEIVKADSPNPDSPARPVGVYGDRTVQVTMTETFIEDFGDVAEHRWQTNARGWGVSDDWDIRQTTLPFTVLPGLQIDEDVAHDETSAGMWSPER